jgi:hypothetical protein
MLKKIEAIICAFEGFKSEDIHVKSREQSIKETRQIIMYFARQETNLTQKVIGEYFDGKDHATVINAVKHIQDLIDVDIAFRYKMNEYRKYVKLVLPEIILVNKSFGILNDLKSSVEALELRFMKLKEEINLLNKQS